MPVEEDMADVDDIMELDMLGDTPVPLDLAPWIGKAPLSSEAVLLTAEMDV